jgi:hypothetical protein
MDPKIFSSGGKCLYAKVFNYIRNINIDENINDRITTLNHLKELEFNFL